MSLAFRALEHDFLDNKALCFRLFLVALATLVFREAARIVEAGLVTDVAFVALDSVVPRVLMSAHSLLVGGVVDAFFAIVGLLGFRDSAGIGPFSIPVLALGLGLVVVGRSPCACNCCGITTPNSTEADALFWSGRD